MTSVLNSLFSTVSGALDFNKATLSGALDIVAVKHDDGTIKCTPFHVRFGKLKVLRSREKRVFLRVNGELVDHVEMKLDASGAAFFLRPKGRSLFEGEEEAPFSFDGGAAGAGSAASVRTASTTSPVASPRHGTAGVPAALTLSPPSAPSGVMSAPTTPITDGEPSSMPIGLPTRRQTVPDALELPPPAHSPVATVSPPASAASSTGYPMDSRRHSLGSEPGDLLLTPTVSPTSHTRSLPPSSPVREAPHHMTASAPRPHKGKHSRRRRRRKQSLAARATRSLELGPIVPGGEMPDDIALPAPAADGQDVGPEKSGWFSGWFSKKGGVPPPVLPPSSVKTDTDSDTDRGSAAAASLDDTATGSDNYDSDATYDRGAFEPELRPSNAQLQALNLHPGANVITFQVMAGRLQGPHEVSCTLYLWSPHSKVVVSDVDGTITKSDILGHLMYFVGRDWTHGGVAALFSAIKHNGYEVLYLTSRAIGQAEATKQYLQNIQQEGGFELPEGPVITSPDRLLTAFRREVIDRQPQIFKIAALSEVKSLFHPSAQPFCAGFGNRDTDAQAYTAVGVPQPKIFIINPKGEINHAYKAYQTSYPDLAALCDYVFPSIVVEPDAAASSGFKYGVPKWSDPTFNDLNFWRLDVGLVESDEEESKEALPEAK